MRPADLAHYRFPPAWRWLIEQIWRVEHAFERSKAEGKAQDDTKLRLFFVLALFTAGFLTLGVGATRSALFPSFDHSGGPTGAPPGARADLVDRNGQLLAVDLPHYGLYFDPNQNWNRDEVRRILGAALPQLSPQRLAHALTADRRQYLIGGLTPEEKDRIDDLGLPGISFEPEAHRVYPLGLTAAHLIGYVDKGEVAKGQAGAERAFDGAIRDNAGGAPVPLSIDLRIQSALQDEVEKAAINFQAEGAIGIVTNVHTGEILGMVSYPTFDPNKAVMGGWSDAMINHAADTVYEPGSVFKVFTLAAGIDAGVATINTVFDAKTPLQIGNQRIHDDEKDNAPLPLWEVFTHSSNIGAARLGLELGPDRMRHYFKSFGLFAAAPSELAESARPILPAKLNENAVASMSFGQAISVSPLAVATGMNAIMNGGEYVPLTIRKLDPKDYPHGRRVISEATSRTMLDLMRLNATTGTGRGADALAPGYRLGGKTGTAQKADHGHYIAGKRVSSFAAVFPTDGPMDAERYFVFILLDSPKPTKESGGFAMGAQTAAPAAGRVVERIAPYLGVKRAPMNPLADLKPIPVSNPADTGEQ
jgi:cell division protein FtsI (penicillin-binding protein 3)